MDERRQFRFDRYVDGVLMAQGAIVFASDENEAVNKARELFAWDAKPSEMEVTEFVNQNPVPGMFR